MDFIACVSQNVPKMVVSKKPAAYPIRLPDFVSIRLHGFHFALLI